jgi:CBS domain-containing protein
MAKSVREAMTANPLSIDTASSVVEAARLMRNSDVGSLPVVERERLVGVITDRDLAVRVLAESGDPQSITVGEVASRDAITGAPEEDLEEALRLMAHHQVRRLPITEDDRI